LPVSRKNKQLFLLRVELNQMLNVEKRLERKLELAAGKAFPFCSKARPVSGGAVKLQGRKGNCSSSFKLPISAQIRDTALQWIKPPALP
jgi:hypothetical protein